MARSRRPEVGEEGFRGPTACALVGITYRQLDYWARTGLVVPSVQVAEGSGSHRLYAFSDVVELRIIKRLLDAGVSLQRIRDAIGYLRSQGEQSVTGLTLMSDGQRIYACRSSEEVIDLLSHGQAVFGIAVGRVVADTAGDVARLSPEQRAAAPSTAPVAEPGAQEATVHAGGPIQGPDLAATPVQRPGHKEATVDAGAGVLATLTAPRRRGARDRAISAG